jgi:poly-beta-hydroxyalkanoate depolymerase
MRETLTIENCDHYDLFTGPRWHDVIHPALSAFWRSVG